MKSTGLPVRNAPGNDPGDVDGGVLLLAPHHVEAQPLLGFRQLNNSLIKIELFNMDFSSFSYIKANTENLVTIRLKTGFPASLRIGPTTHP